MGYTKRLYSCVDFTADFQASDYFGSFRAGDMISFVIWGALLAYGSGSKVLEHYVNNGRSEFFCYYFHNDHDHYDPTTVCQYNIDVTHPEELEGNCDLVLCIKNLNLDAGDFIRINHRDIQVEYRGDNTPSYPIRIWDHKVTFWFSSDRTDIRDEASWAISYQCLRRDEEHDLCNICEELNKKAVLPEDETKDWYRIWA